jgi:hypothetical protein
MYFYGTVVPISIKMAALFLYILIFFPETNTQDNHLSTLSFVICRLLVNKRSLQATLVALT